MRQMLRRASVIPSFPAVGNIKYNFRHESEQLQPVSETHPVHSE
jgi:hypothetical protein